MSPLPSVFLQRLTLLAGDHYETILSTCVDKPTTFRCNTIRRDAVETYTELISLGFELEPVLWCRGAYVLRNKTKRELMSTGSYTRGEIYLQSLASMVPPLLMDIEPNLRVLDMTAAPGSKTSQIAALMHKRGELVASEMSKVRFFKLQHNMHLLGVSDKQDGWTLDLRYTDATKLVSKYPEYFDRVLLDAPCSAEARFDVNDEKSYGYWREEKIREMASVQWSLLHAAFALLRPGGTLVYSTCTFAPEENEYQISQFLNKVGQRAQLEMTRIDGLTAMPLVQQWNKKQIRDDVVERALRVLPTKDIEGFFIAKIKKQP